MLDDASVFLGIDKQQSTKEFLKKGIKRRCNGLFLSFLLELRL
jgi:hypothetical protein